MSDPRAPEADPAALWALRGALALMTVGIALHRFVEPDALSGWLYVDLEAADEGVANGISAVGAGAFALAGVLLLTPLARPAAVWVAAWILGLLVVHVVKDPYWPETGPGAWGVRWLGPIALFLWLGRDRAGLPAPGVRVEWLLRIGAAATFVFHGVKAMGLHLLGPELGQPNAEYLDFVHTFQVAVGGEAFEQATNVVLLRAVGGLDIAVAALILFKRCPWVAAWMAFWGLFTAGLRILQYEETGLARFLTRAPNGGVPLVLLLLWLRRRRGAGSMADPVTDDR